MAINSTLIMNQSLYTQSALRPAQRFRADHADGEDHLGAGRAGASGPKSVAELIAQAKAQPGKLNYGAGTITAQMMGHRFHKAAGLDIVYVPFKGTPETVNGLLTGSVAAHLCRQPDRGAAGRERPAARAGQARPPRARAMADIPTLSVAAGLPDLDDMSVWLGLVAPKGTPKPIVDKLHAEGGEDPQPIPPSRERSERTGNYPVTSTPEEFEAFIRKEAERWSAVLKETGIKFD